MKIALVLLTLLGTTRAFGAVNLVDKNDWKVDMSGFVETDLIYDTTRSFTEKIGNAPVAPSKGQKGRTQMSIRNSRLAFNVQAPKIDNFASRGYMEFDLLGFDPDAGATNKEGAFYNNPTFRVRHAYLEGKTDNWQFLTGQTWALFGWQPYYFIPTIQIAPIPGMLYSRAVQLRAMRTFETGDNTWQFALGVMRPPQRDSQLPSLEAGARWAYNGRKAAFTGGATGSHKPQPLSVGWTGTVRDLETANDSSGHTDSVTGYATAFDVLVPVITSSDGKDVSNNLVIGGEFTIGQAYGDQFDSWTGGQSNPLNQQGTTPESLNSIDAGIVGYHGTSFSAIQLQTFNLYAQYHLPESTHTWVSAGYAELFSPNMGSMQVKAGGDPYDRESSYFANIGHDCTSSIRVAFEYANVKTHYTVSDAAPTDNRFQLSSWFLF